MGCWYKTCGLTNLPIRADEDVYVFVLEKNEEHERCYSTAFFKPLLLTFESKYDEYGGGKDSSGVALPYIMEAIRGKLVEVELGTNTVHDIAVTKETWDIDLFFEAVHENRLKIFSLYDRKTQVDFVMFRKDVVDYILENWWVQEYVGPHNGTAGYLDSYIIYRFSNIIDDIQEYIDVLMESIDKAGSSMVKFHPSSIFKFENSNKVAEYTRTTNRRYSHIIDISDLLITLLEQGDRETTSKLLEVHLKASFINEYMDAVRKVWIPGSYEGSQANDPTGYHLLQEAIQVVLTKEQDTQ